MRYFNILRYLIILSALVFTACGTALPTVKPYKLDVQQGNVVTSKMLLQLRPGMTKSQVRFIMGTPLIQDSFHGNRWDYVYQMREGGKITEQRRVILDFENELLKGVRGDVIPAGSDPSKLDESKGQTGTRIVEPYKKPADKGIISKLKFWEKDEVALAKEAAEKETATKAKIGAVALQKNMETPVAQSVTTPVEEVKSILALPVVVPAVTEAAQPVTPIEASAIVNAEKTEAALLEPAPVAQPTPAQLNAAEKSLEALPVVELPPVKAPVYESPSGMIFDKNLRTYVAEEVAPVTKPVAEAPRGGNKVPPKPKDLPTETEPSFFDRMLEKIGF
ncbi:MAG: outer membrane protein assembly factor BamE [Methylotenera sp.]|nr:outer membrane protein assembly factor BamE [Methylotenera sp.]MDO9232856.1 outer membrane protein assembly factor BamE [Methylotenera sp.]MDO9388901.1 outer membrane protein assembly factor BamE [Methylotenera sp.]MDP2102897.1 outer membrane protein assembly factor BamE [Methylotenera sp.]MDP2281364.1 outer membrane protein assembly factor BamE [Methylotenera sp.]